MKNAWKKGIAAVLTTVMMLACCVGLADRIYTLGDEGEEVRAIEERLIELEYLEGEADGVFDADTEQALLAFQRDNGLLCTGMADSITRSELFSESAQKRSGLRETEALAEEGAWNAYSKTGVFAAGYVLPAATSMPYPDAFHNTEEYGYISESGYLSTLTNPLSTFAAEIDTASYAQVRAKILRGERVPQDAVRVEEMLNYFRYDYTRPAAGEPFGVTMELSSCPWNEDALLLLIGLQAEEVRMEERPDYNLVFLIDTSGSMYGSDRLDLVKRAFLLLLEELRPSDTVSIVAYASMDEVVIEGVSAAEKTRIMEALNSLEAHGSTNGSAGLLRAYEIAAKYAGDASVSRILMATDGDLNVGLTSEGDLARLVMREKENGVKLTVLGFGYGNYKDNRMEALALYGDGNYWYIDTVFEARKALVTEAGGTFLNVAEDVKLQLDFNPAKIAEYRLVGYEDRLLAAEDFANDAVDGGMIGSGHQVTVLYELIPAGSETVSAPQSRYTQVIPGNSAEWLTVSVRAKTPGSDTSALWQYPLLPDAVPEENIRFAAAVAETALLLRDSAWKGSASYRGVQELLSGCASVAGDVYREEFVYLVNLLERESSLNP